MKELKKFLKNRLDHIIDLLDKPKSSYSPETFHQIRVEIKKIDAGFELINFCFKKFKMKTLFEPFNKVFDQAGKVRDLQIEKDLMKKHFFFNTLKDYRKQLTMQEQKEKKSFSALITKSFIGELKNTLDEALPFTKEVTGIKLSNFLDKKKQAIRNLLLKSELTPNEIHDLRIDLKAYYYLAKNRSLAHNLYDSSKDTISPILGKWHDNYVAINHINNVLKTAELSPRNVTKLEKIKTQMAAEEKLLLATAYRRALKSHVMKKNKT